MDDGTTPRDWASRLVFWHWRKMVAIALVGLIAGGVYGFARSTSYTAQAELITGTYTLPSSIANQAAVSTAGPLGLELPADTQARIIASPSIVSIAIQALGASAGKSASYLSGASASAVTENSFTVTATGTTAREAVLRANGLARAYLTYRQNKGRSELLTLGQEATADAKSKQSAADNLDQAIASASSGKAATLQSLLQRQQTLLSAASDSSARAAQLNSAAQSFDGGGSIPRPATVASTAASTSGLKWTLFGLAVGLAGGVIAAVLSSRFSNRLRTDSEITEASGLPVLLDLGGPSRGRPSLRRASHVDGAVLAAKTDAPILAVRAVQRRVSDEQLRSDALVLRPVSDQAAGSMGALVVALGYAATGVAVNVIVLPDEVDATRHDAESLGVPVRSGSTPSDGRGVRLRLKDVDNAPGDGESADQVDILVASPIDDSRRSLVPPRRTAALLGVVRGVDTFTELRHATEVFQEAGLTPVGVIVVPHRRHDGNDAPQPAPEPQVDQPAGLDEPEPNEPPAKKTAAQVATRGARRPGRPRTAGQPPQNGRSREQSPRSQDGSRKGRPDTPTNT